MMTDKTRLGECEGCGKLIYDKDKPYFITSGGEFLCEEHTPMLSDCIELYKDILSRVPYDPGEMPFDNREDMKKTMYSMESELKQSGDRSLAK